MHSQSYTRFQTAQTVHQGIMQYARSTHTQHTTKKKEPRRKIARYQVLQLHWISALNYKLTMSLDACKHLRAIGELEKTGSLRSYKQGCHRVYIVPPRTYEFIFDQRTSRKRQKIETHMVTLRSLSCFKLRRAKGTIPSKACYSKAPQATRGQP